MLSLFPDESELFIVNSHVVAQRYLWPLIKCSWGGMSHHLFSGILLTSSLIGAIIYFYATSRRSAFRPLTNSNGKRVPAMFNLGNTCFANSLLQGLASSKAFFKWVQTIDTRFGYEGRKLLFLDALKRVIQELNDGTKETCSASDVIDALLAHRWSIPPNTEQDLYELFNVFVTTWDEELATLRHNRESPLQKIIEVEQVEEGKVNSLVSKKEPVINSANIIRRNIVDTMFVKDNMESDRAPTCNSSFNSSFNLQSPSSLSFEHVKNAIADEKLLKPPCTGILAVQLRCCREECLYKKIREEKFCVLSLSLPRSPSPMLTFSRLLERYFTAEYIQGASCDRCLERKKDPSGGLMKKQGFCKNKPKQTKDPFSNSYLRVLGGSATNAVFSLPKVKRKWQQGDGLTSSGNGANFYDYDNMFKYKYQLRAVSVHIGQAHSGHFITYRRGIGAENRSNWYKTSDTEVTPVSFAEVSSSEAYMLFYDRALTSLN
uniref:ubiquitinyl hydrolase 1 n=1 Tax=Setaria digitata TaxID=48799 RepID=A0A915Q4U9_9BILA